jgi:5'-phosphate synthase pdxT subunit
MRVGVLSVQGAVSEHIEMTDSALRDLGLGGSAVVVRRVEQLEQVDSLVIPGGESTTISKLIDKKGMRESIILRGREGMPIMGTCAGCVLMASAGDESVERTGTKLLSLMDMEVARNAFGRQKESFEAAVDVSLFEDPFLGVFIRAPGITRVWGECRELARSKGHVFMAGQANFLAVAFHPELSGDSRIHRYFLGL